MFDIVKEWFVSSPNYRNKLGRINPNLYKMIPDHIHTYLNELYDNTPLKVKVIYVENNIHCLKNCFVCGSEIKITKNDKIPEYCSHKCAQNHPDVKAKRIETTFKKYGVKNVLEKGEIRSNIDKNNLEKFGFTCPTKNQIVKEKISESLKDTYKIHKKEIIDKKLNTMIEKYGMHSSLDKNVRNKKEKTCLQKYNVPVACMSQVVKDNIKKSVYEKYGVNSVSDIPLVRQKIKDNNIQKSLEIHKKFKDSVESIETKNHTVKEISNILSLSPSWTLKMLQKNNLDWKHFGGVSEIENLIADWIASFGIKIERSNRKILNGLELDIFLPDYNLAIEVNGIYWHSDQFKNKNYHRNKTDICKNNNIQLLHIFDFEWLDYKKQEIWKSIILNKLGKSNKIYARKCEIREISTKESKLFFDENHLSGFVGGKEKFGLFYDGKLVQAVILGMPRFSKNKNQLELIRAATIKNCIVIGGLSKLLSKIKGPIISYADKRYSSGNGYVKTNFKLRGDSDPNYWYVKNEQIYSRISFQKHKLKDKLEKYDSNLTESENMKANNFFKFWDSGNYIYIRD